MILFDTRKYNEMKNPNPGQLHRTDILTPEQDARELGGWFGLLEPGNEVPMHYHERRESIFIPIQGEVMMMLEGEERLIKTGEVIFMPPMVKHGLVNRSDKDCRYFEFVTHPPLEADFVDCK